MEWDRPPQRVDWLRREIALRQGSVAARWMDCGKRYLRGDHDILQQARSGETGYGGGGSGASGSGVALGAADNRLVHPFLRELVEQKCQYLLGKPFAWHCQDEGLNALLAGRIDQEFRAMLGQVAKDAVTCGIGWIHLYYDRAGALKLRRMAPEEIIPLWADENHRQLDAVIRCYQREEWTALGSRPQFVDCASLWDEEGVWQYRRQNGEYRPDTAFGPASTPQFWLRRDGAAIPGRWSRLPFVPVRYNDEEAPLIQFLKPLIDQYDKAASDFANALEDQPNSVIVLKNYDGQDLAEFRRNLAAYRTVKVSGDGGVDTIRIPVDAQAVGAQLDRLRRDIYALGRGIDHRSGRIQNAASGVALKYEYAALDMDVNGLEQQIQRALAQIVDFWCEDAGRCGQGGSGGDGALAGQRDLAGRRVDFVFNRDIIVNEMEAIEMVKASEGLLDRELLLANHPWTV